MTAIESLRERLLLVENLLQQTTARNQEITQQQTIQMQSHERLHNELRSLRENGNGIGTHTTRIDKTLLPGRYSGDKEKWRMFASKLSRCMLL